MTIILDYHQLRGSFIPHSAEIAPTAAAAAAAGECEKAKTDDNQ